MEVVSKKMKRVLHKHRNMKNCYWCGSVPHMLNYGDIIYNIARHQWFGSTENLQSHHQQAVDKGDEQTVDFDADMSVSSTLKASGVNYKSVCMGAKK